MLGKILFFLLLSIISVNASNTTNVTLTPEQQDLAEFLNLTAKGNDCNPKKTNEWIDVLKQNDSEKATLPKDQRFKKECTFLLTDFVKLRQLLKKALFLEEPGSVVFINSQDPTVPLECGGKKDEGFAWKTLNVPGSEDKGIKKEIEKYSKEISEFKTGVIKPRPPIPSQYIRKYTCEKGGCTHHFYAISRPRVKVSLPLQVNEGGNVEGGVITCEVPTHVDTKKMTQVGWRLYSDAFKNVPQADKDKLDHKGECAVTNPAGSVRKGLGGHQSSKRPYVWKTDGTDSIKIGSVKFNFKPGGKAAKDHTLVSELHIEKAEKNLEGDYECVVVDKHGVPSTPTSPTPQGLHKVRYSGVGQLHVREFYWLGIAGGICVFTILVMALIWVTHMKSDRMEADDGTVTHTGKEQTVRPAESTTGTEQKPPEQETSKQSLKESDPPQEPRESKSKIA